ncbi:hypothetical protein JTB14_024327 [Gonioctena quinquepunctata]|nr:hypothetical protein JTB14_024327 [Gonioctena quinquepunctata]
MSTMESSNVKVYTIPENSTRNGNKLQRESKCPTGESIKVIYFTYALMLLYGVLYVMVLTFFNTATQYWMYKFRDTTFDTIDANNKTTLQSYFQSASMVAQAGPGVIFMILSAFYGHLFRPSLRIIFSLAVMVASYALCTLFVKIDTDNWQTLFFIITMVLLAVSGGMFSLFRLSTIVVISRFPSNFMTAFIFGQSGGGILVALLQILSIAVSDSATISALIYFITGTLIILITLCMTIFFRKTYLYDRYMVESPGKNQPQSLPLPEIVEVTKKIWPCLLIVLSVMFMYSAVHPSITTLVVSEFYDDETAWSDKYFTAVVVFLLGETCGLLGKMIPWNFITKSRAPWIAGQFVIICMIYMVLIMFCNAQPRNHLEVLFNHDYQFIIIFGTFQFVANYHTKAAFLEIGPLSEGKDEAAMKILMLFVAIAAAIFSPLGVVILSIL